ncbi:mitochondrial amidoxime reducing component 2-like protein, partial [Tanacetum coccineum]
VVDDMYRRFVWDRHWVVVNSRGKGCTQRVEPKLALIPVERSPSRTGRARPWMREMKLQNGPLSGKPSRLVRFNE